jgi:hypothetical protein
MFDDLAVKELSEAVAGMTGADFATASPDDLPTVLRVVQTSIDAPHRDSCPCQRRIRRDGRP